MRLVSKLLRIIVVFPEPSKSVVKDLKLIYNSASLEAAEAALLRFGEKWKSKYPSISELWLRNWENVITIFSYPEEIHRVIYTTNAIESLNEESFELFLCVIL